jgi:protein ImuB
MTRIACAFLPRFELALLARHEGPGLWRQPAVIADLSASPVLVREATPAAERAGVRPGMTVAEARVRCGELSVHPPAPAEARANAEAHVLAALARLAPQLASDGRGAFFLGLSGMERLVRDEQVYVARVETALRLLGFAASVGIAGHPFAAWVAARRGIGPVAPGGDARFLASVPLAGLDLSEPARTLLALLGITTAGQVARLPRGALSRRLGPEGERLDRLCRGELFPPETVPTSMLVPRTPAAAGLDLPSPIDALEPLLFLVKGLVGGLLARVAAERKVLAELTVEAELEDAGRSRLIHRLGPAEPTLDVRLLVDLVRLWLERAPFAAPIRSLRVVASKVAPAVARQLRLYARQQDEGEAALERAVARLAAAFGPQAVVRPALASRYLPEGRVVWIEARPAGTRTAAAGEAGEAASSTGAGGAASTGAPVELEASRGGGPDSSPRRLTGAPGARPIGKGDRRVPARRGGCGWVKPQAPRGGREGIASEQRGGGTLRDPRPWALRLLPLPEPVELTGGDGGAPRLLVRRGQAPRRALRIEAVQRRSGEWWEAPFDRSYAWVVCDGGERFWLFHDHLRGGTFLHAVAD